MSTATIEPPKVRWDLSSLFASPDDPMIEQTWSKVKAKAAAFATKYRGKINVPGLQAATLVSALKELEEISQESAKPVTFAHLCFTTDTGNPATGAFLQKQMQKGTELSVELMFFELELQAASQEVIDRVIADPALANYRHYISVARTYSPYRLSEKEEIVLEETANTGNRAWVRLFEELTSNHQFKYRAPGSDAVKVLTQSEVLALFREPDRKVRQAAADAFTEGFLDMQRVLVFTYNNLLQDKSIEDRLRGFGYPQHSRHLSNELSQPTVELVIRLCQQHYGLVERFYKVKREILGLPELTHVDRYAPLFETKETVDYHRARRIVLEAFGQFSPTMSHRANEFFEEGWIDAEPRPGKQGGAFCSYCTPDTHPVVFVNYLNKMDDVMTLAHELGHGVHSSLSRAQTYFNYHGTLPLAELASTFGEMLVFEKITAGADARDRLALYAEKIEGIFATVFRQAAMYKFESECHRVRRESGELTPEQFGEVWQREMQAMFGSSLKLGEQHSAWWSYVGHFVFAPFYVYAYSFGELLVLSLYQMAKLEGPSFEQKYTQMLTLGGSRSPAELMSIVGVDLESEKFWLGGFDAMEKLIAEFERLWGEVRG